MSNIVSGKKTFLITGATGFIGNALSERLKKDHHQVFKLIFPGEKVEDSTHSFPADITKIRVLRNLFKKIRPNIIIHLAACVDSKKDFFTSKRAIQTNILGTLNILEASKELDLECFIHAGSEEVYGNMLVPFSEKDRIDPRTPYAISKVAAEHFALMYHRIYKLPTILLRSAAIYGPGQNCTKLIPMSIISALRGKDIVLHSPDQKRNFLFIDDAIDGILKICLSEKNIKGEIFNFGGLVPYSIREIAEKILALTRASAKIIEKRSPILSSEPQKVLSDISKAKEILGWSPTISLGAGLKETIAWYKNEFVR